MLGSDNLTPYQMHMYKLTFANTSPDWALKLQWPSGVWYWFDSESLLVSSSIYSLFVYGNTIKYIYIAVISVSNGAVSNRYKSSISWSLIYGSAISGDSIIASVYWSTYFLLIFNKTTNEVNVRQTSINQIFGIGVDIATGR